MSHDLEIELKEKMNYQPYTRNCKNCKYSNWNMDRPTRGVNQLMCDYQERVQELHVEPESCCDRWELE